MFTGIVEATGNLVELQRLEEGVRIQILAPFYFFNKSHPEGKSPEGSLSIGDSISVSGVCLTVSEIKSPTFWVDLSPETLRKTYFLQLLPNTKVNLERALKLSDRLGGHFVTGHVDGLAKVVNKEKQGEFWKFGFELAEELKSGVIPKGSIALDGVSLTVNACDNDLEVMIIPETLRKTTLGNKNVGDLVHVELDMIGKYVKHYMREIPRPSASG